LALPKIAETVPAIVEAWFLGSEMGNAVSDVLFGDVNPSGKLPITFPRSVGQVPIYFEHKNTGRPASKNIQHISKYIDQHWTALYPFGHGLSYTTYAYDAPRLSAKKLAADQTLSVTVNVRNTGTRAGEEIVQLYLRDDVASVTRPVRSLRGFQKLKLAVGETQIVTFVLDEEDFALLDRYFMRVVEPGTFTVFVGGSSATDNQAGFEVTDGKRLPGLGPAIPRMLRSATAQ